MFIVVGGRGFLGRHLRDLLARRHIPVAVVSRRAGADDHRPPGGDEIHLDVATFLGPEGARLIDRADALVHLATTSVPATHGAEPWREIGENVAPASELLLRFADRNPAAKRVLISSGGTIYGSVGDDAVDETRTPAPISPYGLGKLMIEETLRFAGRTRGCAWAILRVANPIGRHHTNPEQGVVSVAVDALRAGRPFRLFGDGSAVRDYVDADDVAEAILAAGLDRAHPAATWNVGSGVGLSTLDVLATIERVAGRALHVERFPGRPVDVARIVLDCRRIAADLGWRARHDFDATVAKLVAAH